MKVGDRVCHADGGVGIVETIDDDPRYPLADVRWQTPDNVPSCCVSMCAQKQLTIVGENVLPQPRSKVWKAESKSFCEFIASVLRENV